MAKALALVDRLSPALLAKAFRGELVPTEAELARQEERDYEPASVLLERLRRECAENAPQLRSSLRRRKGGPRAALSVSYEPWTNADKA